MMTLRLSSAAHEQQRGAEYGDAFGLLTTADILHPVGGCSGQFGSGRGRCVLPISPKNPAAQAATPVSFFELVILSRHEAQVKTPRSSTLSRYDRLPISIRPQRTLFAVSTRGPAGAQNGVLTPISDFRSQRQAGQIHCNIDADRKRRDDLKADAISAFTICGRHLDNQSARMPPGDYWLQVARFAGFREDHCACRC